MRWQHGNDRADDVEGSSRGRKSRRKEEVERKKAKEDVIRTAHAQLDPLSSFPLFRRYLTHDGMAMEVESGRGDRLSSPIKQFIRTLLKINMEVVYGSEWPAEEKVKRRDMVFPEARYLFLRYSSPTPSCADPLFAGFIHYRFTLEEDLPVLYIYELQIHSSFQGKGLGCYLMQLVELIARENRMIAVLLTVQKANLPALSFYTNKLKYTVSSISPSRVDPSIGVEKSYEILCKSFDEEAKAIFD